MALRQSVPRILSELPRLPAQAHRDGTAGRILAVGLALFAQKGFHGTSIRDIGDELGLKPANLYAYFRSKEHLLAELVRVGHEEHHATLRRALIASEPGPLQQAAALVRAHVKLHAEYAMLATVANAEMHVLSPELVAEARALRMQSEALFYEVVRHGVALGLFAPPGEWITAAAIASMGMRVAAWFTPGLGITADEIADAHAELALRMLGAKR